MNVTAFLVGLAAALGYYCYTVSRARSNPRLNSISDGQGVKTGQAVLQQERGGTN
jgi:hypothetical protein